MITLVVSLAAASVWLHVTNLLPLLADFGDTLGLSQSQVGLVGGVSMLVPLIAGPVWGIITDRIDRRSVILLSLISGSVAHILGAWLLQTLADGDTAVGVRLFVATALRMIPIALLTGVLVAAPPYLMSIHPADRHQSVIAIYGGVSGLGGIIGMGASLPAPELGVFGVLALSGGLTLLVGLGALRLPSGGRQHQGATAALPIRRLVVPLGFFAATFFVGTLVTFSTSFYLRDQLHLAPADVAVRSGIALLALALTNAITQIVLSLFSAWHPSNMVRASGILLVAGGITLVALARFDVTIVTFVAFGAVAGIVMPMFMLVALRAVSSDAHGRVGGAISVVAGVGNGAGYLLGGVLQGVAPWGSFAVCAGIGVALFALAGTLPRGTIATVATSAAPAPGG